MQFKVSRCEWCGNILPLTTTERQPRTDKKFCCSAHRAKHHRWLHNLNRQEDKATIAIKSIAEYIQHAQAQQGAVQALSRLSELIRVEALANGLREIE